VEVQQWLVLQMAFCNRSLRRQCCFFVSEWVYTERTGIINKYDLYCDVVKRNCGRLNPLKVSYIQTLYYIERQFYFYKIIDSLLII
jgi:hypothetical protein